MNLVDRVVEVHRAPRAGGYDDVSRHGRQATLQPLALADVAIAVEDLLR